MNQTGAFAMTLPNNIDFGRMIRNMDLGTSRCLRCPWRERRLIHEAAIVSARLRCAKDAPNAGTGAPDRLTVSS